MARPDKPDSSVASRTPARALHALSSFWSSLIGIDCSGLLRVAVKSNVRTPSTLDGVVVTGEPVLFHRPPGELVVLGTALIFPCAIDQVNDVANLFIRLGGQQGYLGKVAQLIGKPLEQGRDGDASLLRLLVQVYSRSRAARESDLFRSYICVQKIARQLAPCALEINLEGKRVSSGPAI